MKKTFWVVIFAIIICLVIVVGGIFFNVNNKSIRTKTVNNEQIVSNSEQPEPAKKEHYEADDNDKVDTSDIHPLFDRFGLLIGGLSNNKWINADNISSYIKDGEKYKAYSETELLGEVEGSKSYKEGFISGDSGYYIIFGDKDKDRKKDGVFYFLSDWNVFPRTPIFELKNLDKYNEKLKIIKPSLVDLNAEEVVIADFDGDGIDESLIVASQFNEKDIEAICSCTAEPNVMNKKISLIILNKNKDGKESNNILYESQGWTNYAIPFVADLNNDNEMEIFVEILNYGPMDAEGFAFIDNELIKVRDHKLDKLLHVFWHPFLKKFEEDNVSTDNVNAE